MLPVTRHLASPLPKKITIQLPRRTICNSTVFVRVHKLTKLKLQVSSQNNFIASEDLSRSSPISIVSLQISKKKVTSLKISSRPLGFLSDFAGFQTNEFPTFSTKNYQNRFMELGE